MTLLFTVRVSNEQIMAVYELSEQTAAEMGKPYMLAAERFSDWYLEDHSEKTIVEKLNGHYHERLYATPLEAYLAAKLVAANSELNRMRYVLKEFQNTQVQTIDWDPDFAEE